MRNVDNQQRFFFQMSLKALLGLSGWHFLFGAF